MSSPGVSQAVFGTPHAFAPPEPFASVSPLIISHPTPLLSTKPSPTPPLDCLKPRLHSSLLGRRYCLGNHGKFSQKDRSRVYGDQSDTNQSQGCVAALAKVPQNPDCR
ncbi:uncharacterized protein YALI1_F16369g [Yarrowia lipolytica]|uniref:Uncharacterized protein n=1 Tax=Yarrowia lipolytica TaxID=4952 RepID=A0A1D8NN34_YARLL|nr:hypothetical protein YALI1_F16369g [Yarrowia lipolytica]